MSFCFKASFIHCRREKIAWSFLHSYLIPAQDCEVIIVAMNPEKVCFPFGRMIDMFRGRKNLQITRPYSFRGQLSISKSPTREPQERISVLINFATIHLNSLMIKEFEIF